MSMSRSSVFDAAPRVPCNGLASPRIALSICLAYSSARVLFSLFRRPAGCGLPSRAGLCSPARARARARRIEAARRLSRSSLIALTMARSSSARWPVCGYFSKWRSMARAKSTWLDPASASARRRSACSASGGCANAVARKNNAVCAGSQPAASRLIGTLAVVLCGNHASRRVGTRQAESLRHELSHSTGPEAAFGFGVRIVSASAAARSRAMFR